MVALCPLTCLIIALYDEPQPSAYPENEHAMIVEAVAKRDEARAIELMLHHLHHIEQALHLDQQIERDIHWEALYG